jgi:hypothetical protein
MVKLGKQKVFLRPNEREAAGWIADTNVFRANCRADVEKDELKSLIEALITEFDLQSRRGPMSDGEMVVWPRHHRNASATIRIGRCEQQVAEEATSAPPVVRDVLSSTSTSAATTLLLSSSQTNVVLSPRKPGVVQPPAAPVTEHFRVVEAKVDVNVNAESDHGARIIRQFFNSLALRFRKADVLRLTIAQEQVYNQRRRQSDLQQRPTLPVGDDVPPEERQRNQVWWRRELSVCVRLNFVDRLPMRSSPPSCCSSAISLR